MVRQISNANILDRIEERFGSQLQELTVDDKASLLICLVDTAINPQQVFIQPNFYSSQNGGEAWGLAEQLSPQEQLKLAVAICNQLVSGGLS